MKDFFLQNILILCLTAFPILTFSQVLTPDTIGVGTNNPKAEMHVKGEGVLFILEGLTKAYMRFFPQGLSGGLFGSIGYVYGNKDLGIINSTSDGGIRLAAGNMTRLVISSNGNIGVNTMTPLAKFHIKGPIRGDGTGCLRIQTDFGYIEVGPNDSDFAHILTDRDKFFLNKRIVIGGGSLISSQQSASLVLATQNGNNEIVHVKDNGDVEMAGGVQLDNATQAFAGMVQWTGNDFEGFNGNEWVSFTNSAPQSLWVTVSAGNSCHNQCPDGHVAAADVQGKVCKTTTGSKGTFVEYVDVGGKAYMCGTNSYSSGAKNSQCHCIRVQ